MKFDQIVLSGATESIVLFDHKQPRSTPYTARTIDGLGPTDVDVTLAQTSQGTGIYIGRREQLREITANIFFNPNYFLGQTPESLREEIYLLRPGNDDLSLDFRLLLNGIEVAMTPVYVKRVEVAPFSKDSILQIVLASTSGYFHQRDPEVLTNPDLDKVLPTFVNKGSVETGFKLIMEFTGQVTSFGLHQSYPTNELSMVRGIAPAYLFTAGDVVEINTNIGERGIWLKRGAAAPVSIINRLTNASTWLSLYPGENQIRVATNVPGFTGFTWRSIEHTPKFKGV